MGILDTKTRMFDTIITQNGRQQLAAGTFNISFVSFTDVDTFYQADASSGSDDPSERLYFEVTNLPQDQITFEADDSGRLVPFRGASLDVAHGKVLSGSTLNFLDVVTGSVFASRANTLLSSSIENFQKLYTISNDDVFFDADDEFVLNIDSIKFDITDDNPIHTNVPKRLKINKIESLFQDKKLSRVANFKYLPPRNKSMNTEEVGSLLGNYPALSSTQELTLENLMDELKDKQSVNVDFLNTSQMSNIFGQMFEVSSDVLRKLDVIDFGEFVTDDENYPVKHVFFAGRLFIDDFGTQTFVNMFTMIFS